MSDARKLADPGEFLEAFAGELRRSGIDVSRITTGVPILHPQIFSFSSLWELGKGASERLFRAGPNVSATMSNSPDRCAMRSIFPIRGEAAAICRAALVAAERAQHMLAHENERRERATLPLIEYGLA